MFIDMVSLREVNQPTGQQFAGLDIIKSSIYRRFMLRVEHCLTLVPAAGGIWATIAFLTGAFILLPALAPSVGLGFAGIVEIAHALLTAFPSMVRVLLSFCGYCCSLRIVHLYSQHWTTGRT